MIERIYIDTNLLEDFREELSPRLIGDCGHTPELSNKMVETLYHAISDYLANHSEVNLTANVMQSLGEVP